MIVCPSCGHENSDTAKVREVRHWHPLPPPACSARPSLSSSSDVTGSTPLGE